MCISLIFIYKGLRICLRIKLDNKVTTGCGGTYVALNDPEPTIIIVPTKALVRDKVTQEKYKHLNLLGISSDYPLTKIPEGCSKIICTYQSLPMLAEKIVISNWNLVVDEMHLLTRMLSFSRSSLGWLLNNFKNFKSYCFMSATIPKRELLLDELKEIDMVEIEWPNLEPVSFECYHSSNIYETMLQICGEHLDGTREGNAYFFYNTVDGICKLVTTIRKIPEYKHKFACMVSDSKYTKEKLRKVGTSKESAYNRLLNLPYNFRILQEVFHPNPVFIFNLRKHLISLETKYMPKIPFDGQTNCIKSVDAVLDYLSTLIWVEGIKY